VLTTLLSFYFVPALVRLLAQRRTFGVTGVETAISMDEAAGENSNKSATASPKWSVCRFIGKRAAA
jgi:hypothetical protein